MEPDQQSKLLKLLKSARVRTEKEFGYRFECALFLRKYEDLEMLQILREETDRKILSAIPEILDARQARLFEANWKALREEQFKHSEFTARVIRQEDS